MDHCPDLDDRVAHGVKPQEACDFLNNLKSGHPERPRAEERSERESKDPETVSFAMPIQGVLPESLPLA
jgi:hypothetical protein